MNERRDFGNNYCSRPLEGQELKMETKSEHVILLGSLDKPDRLEVLDAVLHMVRMSSDWDVVIDLSDITINSMVINKLLELRDLVRDAGRQLIFCGVACNVKSVFTVAGLDAVFWFVPDRATALAELDKIQGRCGVEAI